MASSGFLMATCWFRELSRCSSHCVTASWLETATKMRAKKPSVSSKGMLFLPQPFQVTWDRSAVWWIAHSRSWLAS